MSSNALYSICYSFPPRPHLIATYNCVIRGDGDGDAMR